MSQRLRSWSILSFLIFFLSPSVHANEIFSKTMGEIGGHKPHSGHSLPIVDLWIDYFSPEPNGFERQKKLNFQWSKSYEILSGFGNMYQGNILFLPHRKKPFAMWFFGWASEICNHHLPEYKTCDAIFFARSNDLFHWEVYTGGDPNLDSSFDRDQQVEKWQPILSSRDLIWDSWHTGDPSVIYVDGTYYMAYSVTGKDIDGQLGGQPEDHDGDFFAIGGATSQDGIHWKRLGQPLLVAKSEWGASDPAPMGLYHRPSLMYEEGRFKLWFDYWAGDKNGGISMGYAELVGKAHPLVFQYGQWKIRQGENRPAIPNWPNPVVVKVKDLYYSYADPVGFGEGWPGRKIAEAISTDGKNWTLTGHLEPDSDCAATHVPEVFRLGSTLVMTKACQIGEEGGDYDYRYKSMKLQWKTYRRNH